MRRTAVSGALAVLLVLVGAAAAWAGGTVYRGFPVVRVVVNGHELQSDVPAISLDGRTLLPVRAVSEALGAQVEWDDKTQTVFVTGGSKKIGPTYLMVPSTQEGFSQGVLIVGNDQYDGFILVRSNGLSVVAKSDLEAAAAGTITAQEFGRRSQSYLSADAAKVVGPGGQQTSACEQLQAQVAAAREEELSRVKADLAARGVFQSTAALDLVGGVVAKWNGVLRQRGCAG